MTYYNIRMYVYLDPPEITANVADVTQNETSLVFFSCEAIGEPSPSISWHFNDVLINKFSLNLLLGHLFTEIYDATKMWPSDKFKEKLETYLKVHCYAATLKL